jgi:uncharacterized protein YjdB
MNYQLITSTRNRLLTFVLAGLLATCGCAGGGSGSGNNVTLASITVAVSNPNVIVGQTEQLTATGKYSDKSTKDLTSSVAWSTSPAGLATVAAGGMLTAQASGKVTVTASASGVSGTTSVTIAPKLVSIAVTPLTQTIAKATKQQFIATGTYSDNSTQIITGNVSWTSSNPAVATISTTTPTSGLALGVSAGSTSITASSGTITSPPATLNVTSASATGLSITGPTSLALFVSQQFTVMATFSDGTSQDVTNVATWSSGSTSIATVTVSGLVTARSLGTTNISAVFESANDSSPLTVDSSNLDSISISPEKGTIAQGTEVNFIATGHFNNGSTNSLTGQVNWSSSDPTIAKFGSINQVSGLKPGTVTITATLGSVTGSTTLTVSNATIQSVTVTPVNQTIAIGWHQGFTATGKFSDGTNQDISASVTWSSDNLNIAAFGTPGSSAGVVKGVATGSANITALFSFGGTSKTDTTKLTVSSASLSSISINPTSALLAPGSTLQVNAKGTWTNGSSQNINVYVNWSSSDKTVASVGISGSTTGQQAGVATITATVPNTSLSATSHLIVEGSNLVSIKITPQNLKLPATIETQLKATGTFSDGQQLDLTSAVTWTSSTPSVATVSNASTSQGVATGVSTGTSTVTAAFAGMSATTTLTVTNATLVSIDLMPANPSISLGTSQQFTAQGTFSDSSVVNISVQTTWSSSDVAIATINSSGTATSASTGSTTIKASLNGVNGTTILTVH